MLPGWKSFERVVLEGDWRLKFDARGNRQWAGNPAGKGSQLISWVDYLWLF